MKVNPAFGHGFKSRMAKALQCQSAYISQVLNSHANFSLEQTEELNELLNHSVDEAQFLRLLVQLERAGSAKLRTSLKREIEAILKRREKLRERVDQTASLTTEQQTRYYSRWYYSAVHIICTIPEYQTRDKILEALKIEPATLEAVLEFLQQAELLKLESGRFHAQTHRLFLGNDAAMISQLHTNWRLQAVKSLDRQSDRDLHFSTCVSLSKDDYTRIKDQLIESINRARAVVKDSKEEDLCCLAIDFFSLLA